MLKPTCQEGDNRPSLGKQVYRLRNMLMRATRASLVEQWLPEIGKADAVDRDRPISLHIFADVRLVDRLCEDITPHRCD